MEIDYGSDGPSEELKRCMMQAERAEKLAREIKPFPRPLKNRFERLFAIGMQRENSMKKTNNHQILQTFVTANKHSSKVSDWRTLKPILLKDMMANMVHTGRYLLCRVISEFYSSAAMITVIEDESGEVEDLSIYNYRRDYNQDPSDILPVGTVMIIKEPFVKPAMTAEGYFIRVDSPSDIEIIYDTKLESRFSGQLIPKFSFDHWKAEGNKNFSNKKYQMALRCYEQALKIKDCPVIHLNCAAAYLGLDFYWQAFKSAEQSLKSPAQEKSAANEEKARFRMGKAAYGMRQWKLAIECFEQCLKTNGSNQQAKQELDRSKQRLHESLTGEISLKKLLEDSVGKKGVYMDVADYVNHEKIMVKDLGPEKGKGVVAKTFIKKGTLLVVSKAFSIGFEDEKMNRERIVLSLNLVKKSVDVQSQVQNLIDLVFKIRSNPYLAKEFYSLYGGSTFNRDERLCDGIVDMARLEAICCVNSFSAENVYGDIMSIPMSQNKISQQLSKSSGVWLFPSYLNHSCIANTSRVFFGDVVVITASKDIREGEEITLVYESPATSYKLRQKKFKAYNFHCQCPLCRIDSKDPTLARRTEYLDRNYEKIRAGIDRMIFSENQVEEFVQKVKESYQQRTQYQLDLYLPLSLLADVYLLKANFRKAGETFLKIYQIFKETATNLATLSAIQAVNSFNACNMTNEACESLRLAVESNCLGDEDFFFQYFGKNLNQ